MSIRLIAYLSAAALAAVVLAYGFGRWQGSAAERRACEAELHAAERKMFLQSGAADIATLLLGMMLGIALFIAMR